MKQATLKAAGTAALAIAAVAAGTASAAAAPGLSALPTGGLPDTGGATSTLSKTPLVGGPVAQTTGLLGQGAGQQATAGDQTAAAPTRALPVAAVQGVTKQAGGPLGGVVGSAVPLSGGLPLGG
ncbi:hypothetical protein [Kitasatospora viridis]|uniref:ATP-binding protein n=1 Tax=Kitasatospora viridis TaxID=281105 RepID=A0A561UJS2_9ACTN|nr:hypothetical protein [Kitasatospora viridis]TWF99608.1 hypothetical protein FHX73_113455 [Kitasatospora viridis]